MTHPLNPPDSESGQRTVAGLFVRRDSIYKTLPGVDCWDEDRDALKWPGGCPVVAHPPCGPWGRMRQFCIHPEQKPLALWAVEQVQRFGGCLEHPAESTLWREADMPRPGFFPDIFGGHSISINQYDFGHRAEKSTWIYIVGCATLPPTPKRQGKPTHCIRPTRKHPRMPSVTKPEREHTPPDLARWLVEVARRCQSPKP